MSPNVKLHYFNGRSRGETIRWILSYVGQDFEDVRISEKDWPAIKATTPYGQVPVLEVDGKRLAQSRAIARYLAREHGLLGRDSWEQGQVDALVDYIADASGKLDTWRHAVLALGVKKATKLQTEYIESTATPTLQKLEHDLASKPDGQTYFTGNKLTWADLTVAEYVDEIIIASGDETVLDKYPRVTEHSNGIRELPGIKEWLHKRPNTAL